jgi:FixJ family two-component response regulator
VVSEGSPETERLTSLLRSAGLVVRSFGSAEEFMACFSGDEICCLVLNERLPGRSGLDLQRELRGRASSLPVVFVSEDSSIPICVRAMKAGAVGFLTRPFGADELLALVGEALAMAAGSQRLRVQTADARRRYAALTPRERSVMALVIAGLPNKLVAVKLAISEVTVKVHRGQVMRKLQASSVPDLVRIASRLELG